MPSLRFRYTCETDSTKGCPATSGRYCWIPQQSENTHVNFFQGFDEGSRGKQSFEGREMPHHSMGGGRHGFHMQGPRLSQLKATSVGSSDSLLSQGIHMVLFR